MAIISTVMSVKNIEMSATSALDSEDLENIPLVRMADVQPDRDEMYRRGVEREEEYIVPDNIEPVEKVIMKVKTEDFIGHTGSWPTLEILPGGVIKHAVKQETDLIYHSEDFGTGNSDSEKIYVCAKCQHRFKYLFSLVKHVRRHEDEKKINKFLQDSQIKTEKKQVCLQNKKKVMSKIKKKCKVPKI